jgi:hypothetical protein
MSKDAPDDARRTLPSSIVGTRTKSKTKSRDDRKKKLSIFYKAYDTAVAEIGNPRLTDIIIQNKCWREVCSHRFCSMDLADPVTISTIHRLVRHWVENENRKAPQSPTVVAIPPPPPPPTSPTDMLPPIARLGQYRWQPGPAPQPIAPAPPEIGEWRDYGRMMRPILDVRADVVANDMESVNVTRITALFKGFSPDSLNAVLQDMPPAFVEHMFAALGLDGVDARPANEDTCTTCEEKRTTWARMTTRCRHKMCIDCAAKWARNSAISLDGHGCPECARDGSQKKKCLVDPRLMFGADGLRETQGITTFTSFQLPALQAALDIEMAEHQTMEDDAPVANTIHRCPRCSTVSVNGNGIIRRCHNPQCAIEFCLKCNCEIDASEDMHSRHIGGACIKIAEETANLAAGAGITACPRCKTKVWHASYHGCHCVRCPTCAMRFCHACSTPYDQERDHVSNCKCPIFCHPDSFACRCARSCPECETSKCEHCDGNCINCLRNVRRTSGSIKEK